MRNQLLTIFVVASLSGLVNSLGGAFSTDFSDPNQPGFRLNGSAVIQNTELIMTRQGSANQGSFVLDDLDTGAAIESFTATFQLKFGPSSIPPADGFCFSFGPDITSTANFGVDGGGLLSVEFDTYDNSSPDNVGIDVKLGGAEIATTPMNYADLVDSQFHDVFIQLKRNGTLNVVWNARTIYTNLVLPEWAPVNGQFAFGASTGYFDEECDVENLSVTTTQVGSSAAPTITTQLPAKLTVTEATPLQLVIGFDGSAPLGFQWDLNGSPIPGATTGVLDIPEVPLAYNNGQITCTVFNSTDTATSQATLLTVVKDTTPPAIKSVAGSENFKNVTVNFSKAVLQSTAQELTNYSIAGLTLKAVLPSADDESKVVLTTSAQTLGAPYTIVINNIQDKTSTANTIAPNSQKTFHAFSYVSGFMTYDMYENMGFTAGSSSLTSLENQFNNLVPTRILVFTSADTPDWNYSGNYGSVSQGLIVAPETGSYIFHVASDDQSQLFLSTDDTPAHLRSVCQITTWDGHLDWAGASKGSPSTSPQSGNVSLAIHLDQGLKYYFRDFHVDGTGPDGISIGWELPSSPGKISVIPGSNLEALMNTDIAAVPSVSISRTLSGITIMFTGGLQSAESVTGPWTDLSVTNPLVIKPIGAMKFYRAKQ